MKFEDPGTKPALPAARSGYLMHVKKDDPARYTFIVWVMDGMVMELVNVSW